MSNSNLGAHYESKFGKFDNSTPLNDGVPVREMPALKMIDGTIYHGEWDFKGRRHGRGVEELSEGGNFIGYFAKDKKTGKGRMVYSNGSFYQGYYLDGLYHGYGVYIH